MTIKLWAKVFNALPQRGQDVMNQIRWEIT